MSDRMMEVARTALLQLSDVFHEHPIFQGMDIASSAQPEITEARPESTMTTKVAEVRNHGSWLYFNALPGERGLSSWARVYSEEDELYRFYRECAYSDPGFQCPRTVREFKFKCMDSHGYTMNE